ncbi:hypothetical protein KFL_002530060 [Klebsormidium nitens]|uniref:F-box domain-containing protein n=1 Tax=Klebsormidium nitens TaxID=105231 RepID=A0A1Y1I9G5_KLENI|nr:hypothetical protein KFL_002530060 [Klebsormidium nitens]|eukprot:GAQ85761.1 hypothetical protein KFL_002530060 [Klebsormidium nitens]
MDLLELPGDTLTHLLTFLDAKGLAVVSRTCDQMRVAAGSEVVWKQMCQPWSDRVKLEEWRPGMQSYKALYRLLRDLERLVGTWSAKEMAPKGGLLHVIWSRLSVVACRVQPQSTGHGLLCMRLFEVIGCPDGTSLVNLLTGRDNIEVCLPGALNLDAEASEFFLESLGPPDSIFPGRRGAPPPLFGVNIERDGGQPAVPQEGAVQQGEASTREGGESSQDAAQGASASVSGEGSRTLVYGDGFPKWLPGEKGVEEGEPSSQTGGQASSWKRPPEMEEVCRLQERSITRRGEVRAVSSGTADQARYSLELSRVTTLSRVRGLEVSSPDNSTATSVGVSSERVSSERVANRVSPEPVRGGSGLTAEEARRQYLLRVHLRQQQLVRNLWLGAASNPELQQLEARAQGQGQGQAPGEIRRHAYEYLLRLANTPRGPGCPTEQLPGRTVVPLSTYKKIAVPEPSKVQELAGLWSGVYGPHGREILLVTYTDDNRITATKMLGDPNVPCGEVSFQVKLESERTTTLPGEVVTNSLDVEWEEIEQNIVKRYRGYGRVAGYGFRYPQWVPGQLLVEKNGNFAFLWEDVNFIIRFHRVDVHEIVSTQLAKLPPFGGV